MNAERWDRGIEIFSTVLDLDRHEWRRYLDEECAHDPELRAEVESLLINHAMANEDEFLVEPPWVIDEMPLALPDFEEYTCIEYIGHGGMGVVYRAFDDLLKCPVALKTALPSRLTTAADVNRFRVDPRSMAQLLHSNIVQVHKVGDCGGLPYFTMNLIERKDHAVSLQEHVARYQSDLKATVELMIKVARAVAHAHQRGILHRDLKPANILLDDDDEPYITDFGLAKQIGGDAGLAESSERLTTASGTHRGIAGTAQYMSPEQADPNPDRELTTLCDVYGIGATLYALLTGHPPFRGNTVVEILQKVRDEPPELPHSRNPQLAHWRNRHLESICLKCLQKDPQQRYQSADALANDLQRWLDEKPPVGVSVRPVDRARLLCRRRPATVGLTFVALALLLFVTFAAIDVAQKRAIRLEDQVIDANSLLANHVASTALLYFEDLSRPVQESAWEIERQGLLAQDDLQRDDLSQEEMQHVLVHSETGRSLEALCKQIFDYQNDPRNRLTAFKDERMRSYVFNSRGILLAHWPTNELDTRGRLYSGRDYFKHHRDNADSSIHVSRVFKSERDGLYKCAVSIPVRDDGGTLLGVVATTIPTSSTLGPDRWGNDRQRVVLVARGDQNASRPGGDAQPYKQPILLHPAYPAKTTEEEVVEFPNGERLPDPSRGIPELERPNDERSIQPDRSYEDPILGEHWLAAFAPVGNTEFWVVVQQQYRDAIPPFLPLDRTLVVSAATLFLLLLAVLTGAFYWIRRSRRSAGVEFDVVKSA